MPFVPAPAQLPNGTSPASLTDLTSQLLQTIGFAQDGEEDSMYIDDSDTEQLDDPNTTVVYDGQQQNQQHPHVRTTKQRADGTQIVVDRQDHKKTVTFTEPNSNSEVTYNALLPPYLPYTVDGWRQVPDDLQVEYEYHHNPEYHHQYRGACRCINRLCRPKYFQATRKAEKEKFRAYIAQQNQQQPHGIAGNISDHSFLEAEAAAQAALANGQESDMFDDVPQLQRDLTELATTSCTQHEHPPSPFSFIAWPRLAEILTIADMALPLMAGFFSFYSISLVNTAFVGHLGSTYLAAGALSTFFTAIFALNTIQGMNAALDTLAAQAYGAKAFKRVGLIAQRAFLVQFVVIIPVIALFLNCRPLLEIFTEDDSIVEFSVAYCRICTIAFPFIIVVDVLRRYLEVQANTIPAMLVNITGLLCSFPLNYFFIHVLDYGFIGAAYSYVLINVAMCCTLVSYILMTGVHRETWPPLSLAIFQELPDFLNKAFFGFLVNLLEWLAFEIQSIVAARLGTKPLAAQLLVNQINTLLYNVQLSMSICASVRVGQHLGAGRAYCARFVFHTVLITIGFPEIIVSGSLFFLRGYIPRIFSNDPTVCEIVSSVLPLLSIFCFCDGISVSMGGVMRGASRQNIASLFLALGYWVVALPLSLLLAFHVGTHNYYDPDMDMHVVSKGLGVEGQWIALICGSFTLAVSSLTYLSCINWKKCAEVVSKQVADATNNSSISGDVLDSGDYHSSLLTDEQIDEQNGLPFMGSVSQRPFGSVN